MDQTTTLAPAARAKPLGAYRRAVRLTAEVGVTTAEMEDDVHHFEVVLRHEGDVVTNVDANPIRTPWAPCPGAAQQLKTLEGCTSEEIRRKGAAERAEHCLHLYDLAILGANHMGERGFQRLYRVEVDHDTSPPLARIWCDGVEVLSWGVDGKQARGSRYDGVAFADLAGHLAATGAGKAETEAALILRRASLISFVRRFDLDAFPNGKISMNGPANCYAKRPGRREGGGRNMGTSRDLWGAGVWPLTEKST